MASDGMKYEAYYIVISDAAEGTLYGMFTSAWEVTDSSVLEDHYGSGFLNDTNGNHFNLPEKGRKMSAGDFWDSAFAKPGIK